MNLSVLKNKNVIIAIAISLFILVLIILLSPKQGSTPTSPTQVSAPRPELIDLSQAKRRETMVYVASIEDKLPLYLESFQTSVGIDTTINIYRLKDDEAEVVRLEIYGLSYLNQDSNEAQNPNVTAFKESYLKAFELLESQNIDPRRLIFIYGDKEYVRTTTQTWLTSLKLRI